MHQARPAAVSPGRRPAPYCGALLAVGLLGVAALAAVPACSGRSDSTGPGPTGGADTGPDPDEVDCAALPPWEGARTCWHLMHCLQESRSRDCWNTQCLDAAPEASAELLEAALECDQPCASAATREEYVACTDALCLAPMLACAADSLPDSCWGLEACYFRDCEPMIAEGCAADCAEPEGDACAACRSRVAQPCADRCYDAASEGCRRCRAGVDSTFQREHCPDETARFQRCVDAHECLDWACAEASCAREADAIDDCFVAAAAAEPDGYRARLDTCYPQPD